MNFKIKYNSIMGFLMFLLFCSFVVFGGKTWGIYAMLSCIVLIFLFHVIRDKLRYRIAFGTYLGTILLFAIYTLMSSIWAQSASDAITQGITLLEIFLMIFILYNCYRGNEQNVQELLKIIKWSSFMISVYSIFFYGIDTLILMSTVETRLETTYVNVNTIGMLAAVGTLIQIDEMVVEKKIKLTGLLCVPMVYILALTQSRKSFVILVIGIFSTFIFRNIDSQKFLKKILKVVFVIIMVGIVLYIVLSSPIFSGLMKRMEGLLANFTGIGEVDNSARVRNKMIQVGLAEFRKNPILGIGMGNTHYVTAACLGIDTYLHNNFVELLAGGGIVGFTIYYSMYVYLFVNFWKYRKYKNKEYTICFIIMFLFLAMDYGMVSYYSKIRYVYLLIYFLEVDQLKERAQHSI